MHALLLSLLPLLAPAPALADDVSVTTADGETIVGEVRLGSIKVTTDFGSAVVELEQLGRIEFGDPDVVVTRGGTELRGEVELRSLRIKTADGSKTVRRADLVLLTTLDEGRPFGLSDFGGAWSSSFGPMKLEQKGTTVEGKYGFSDEGLIEGRIEDGRLAFKYRSAGGSGEGWFELWEDGRTFTGEYVLASGEKNFWGAYRLEPKLAPPRPGEVSEGQTESMLNYYLRVPKDYDGGRKYPALAFFHGSNMSSRSYVETLASTWPELAEDYIVVGFDGERIASRSGNGSRYFNATYINFSGHEVGEPWRHRQTPGLVADALKELGEALPIEHWFVGGHSQGGFLTYAVVMFYPELVRGAFPMSCNLLVQCEPSYFDDEAVRAAQRRVALAPIHGENDRTVEFSGGVYCYEAMQDGGFPALRFFTHPSAGHSFMHLPVEDAVRWLEALCSDDAEALCDFAREAYEQGEYRDALAALLRAEELDKGGKLGSRIGELHEEIDVEAAPEGRKLEKTMRKAGDASWVDDFWEFRRRFAFARGAKDVMAAYAKLREEHQKPAEELFWKARNESDAEKRKAGYMEIVERYYASRYYRMIRRWYE